MRKYAADALKSILIILVVIGHIFISSAEDDPRKGIIYLFHMPVFLALSGYLFAAQRSVSSEALRAWRRYLLPWIIATVAFFVLFQIAKGKSPFGPREALLLPWFHLWFVPALFVFSMSAAAIRKPLPLLALWGAPIVFQAMGWTVPLRSIGVDARYLYFGVYFALGYASRHFFTAVAPKAWTLALVPALAITPFLYPHFTMGPGVDLVRAMACIGAMAAIATWPGSPNVVAKSIFARESLGIYLYHPAPLLFLKTLEPRLGSIIYWAASLITTLALVPLAVSIARRIPVVRLALGEMPAPRPQADLIASH